ncbi:PAS domain-containing hybrid sensor histidine kinase/response regulator [Lewinella sp. W8]|uniref:hybrid sensor histidine kinase/response regulator n=1 Tax=Lewinella sp. W8 TaxID=2528208 RepID=UPI0010673AE1|nr:PAS domain-containing hybrid sensor histidine kinase/response regulator [Lewinella sp. W8]MTB50308.1 PAS domain-containing protein [Lewinella sp. W8]
MDSSSNKHSPILSDILLEIALAIGNQTSERLLVRKTVPLLLKRLECNACGLISSAASDGQHQYTFAVPGMFPRSSVGKEILSSKHLLETSGGYQVVPLDDQWIYVFSPAPDQTLILRRSVPFADIQIKELRPIVCLLINTYQNLREKDRRLAAEQESEADRRLLKTVLDYLPDAIYLKDGQRRKVLTNAADLKHTGFTAPEDILGKTDEEVFSITGKNSKLIEEEILSTGIPVENRVEILHNDFGKEAWMLTSKFPFLDGKGKITGIVGISRDITRQRELNKELERLSLVASQTTNGVIITDKEGYLEWVNEGFTKISGFTLEEVIGKRPGDFLQGPETDQEVVEIMRKAIQEHRGFDVEVLNYNKQREPYWIKIICNPMLDEEGKVQGFMAIESDITLRKENEQEILAAKQLAENAQQAEEAFLANMSHEIRTPLNAVIGMVNLLYDTELSEEQLDYVTTLDHSANFLHGLISNVLDIAKIQSGSIDVVVREVRLHNLMENLLATYRNKVLSKPVSVMLQKDAALPDIVLTDPVILQQILNNLLSNAEKFTRQGEIGLSARVVNGKDQAMLQLSVWDTGEGIPADKLDQVFLKFKQIDAHERANIRGSGLGLAITKELVGLLGGRIEAQSERGKGSTFSVWIPLVVPESAAPESRADQRPAPITSQNTKHMNILVVEDNRINQKYIIKLLEKLGVQQELAENGEDALLKAAATKFDVILMDIQLPGINGYQVTQKIRSTANPNRDTRIIALTASAMRQDVHKAMEAGMNDFLSKPFKPKELIEKLR